jgi:uroporphyrinogen-III synthase
MLALTNLMIMVTRPAPAGLALCELITKQGGKSLHFPTIAFAPADQAQLNTAIDHLDEQAWWIFISPQAVYASLPAIRRRFPVLPAEVKLAAVGGGTAAILQEAGYEVSAYPSEEWNSEGLLALPPFQVVETQKIAIIRGEGGREFLAAELIARGAIITPVIAYQRILPNLDITTALHILKTQQLDVIICGSFEGVRHLKTLLTDEAWPYLNTLPLVVMSKRVKLLAEDLGFQTIWVAENASHAAVLTLLAQKRNELCQIKMNKN